MPFRVLLIHSPILTVANGREKERFSLRDVNFYDACKVKTIIESRLQLTKCLACFLLPIDKLSIILGNDFDVCLLPLRVFFSL